MAITRTQIARQLYQAGGGADFGAPDKAEERASKGYGNPSGGKAASEGFKQDAPPGGQDPQVYGVTGKQYDPAAALAAAKAKAEAEAKEKRKTIRERLKDFNLKRRQDYINRILSQRQKKISAGLFNVKDMPGVDLMETEDYFGFAPSITDYGPKPEGTGKYSQQFIDDVLSGKRQPPEFFSEIDVGDTAGLTTKGLATIANFLGKGMAGEVTREALEGLDKEKKDIMDIDPSKTTINEMMEIYEPNRFKLLNPEPGGDGPIDPCKGPNPPAYCFVNNTTTEPEPTGYVNPLSLLTPRIAGTRFLGTKFEEEDDTEFAADGGRIGAMGGGIMNVEDLDREAFLLGGIAKGLKKAVKGVKKLVKSPIGKAALGAALFGGFGGGLKRGLFGITAKGQALRGFPELAAKKGLLAELGLTGGYGSFMPTIKGGILGTSLLSGLTAEEDKGDDELAKYLASQKLEPSQSIRGMGTELDFYGGQRMRVADGGDVEPVAKKTMPLLDMDGKEKDYRETGGFVDMGRMEKADDVPARLSKNEFVFTADAVRNAGEGDIDKGAEVMYNMMKNLESGGDVSEESQGLDGAREMFQTSQRLGEVI